MFLCKKAIPLQICIKDNFSIRCYSINNLLKSAKKDKASSYLMRSDTRLLRRLQPEDCAKMFQQTVEAIDAVCKKFPDKKIVVITHHAPSMMSVPREYKNDETTPCYASNLEDFILDRPNIKLWCHGHIHQASDYEIGDCRVVCNPRGYVKYGEPCGFNPNLVIEVE